MTNKLKYFVGNWKMFGDFSDYKIIKRINHFADKSKKLKEKKKIILCVPNTLIYFFKKKLKRKFISLGAQNCNYHLNFGPYTGSVSAAMLKKAGAEYVILGHSENRREGESSRLIKKKITSALKQNLNVIFCIGETLYEKKRKKTFSVLRRQIKNSLERNFDINKIIIAYEPVWSIGSNKIPKAYELKKIAKYIKKTYLNIFKTRKIPKILYGGSVNRKNIRLFSSLSDIDGFLIGGASTSAKKFIDILINYYK